MPYLYILKSLNDGNLYTGTCSDNLEARLKKHNDGKVSSTRNRCPLNLIRSEYFSTLSETRKREWELKYTRGEVKKRN